MTYKVVGGLNDLARSGSQPSVGLLGPAESDRVRQVRVNNVWDPARQCYIRPSGQRTSERTTLM